MAAISQETAEAQLAQWLAVAEDIATNGQSSIIAGRTFTHANLKEVREMIDFWERKANRAAAGGGIRVRGITPA